MFQHQGMWLPDGERHFPEWMDKHGEVVDGRGTYQVKKWRGCLPWLRLYRRAVDVGAHVGFWSIPMARCFTRVEAFEPVGAMRACYVENLGSTPNVTLHATALGDRDGYVRIAYVPADSGGTYVERDAAATDEDPAVARIRTLDSFAWPDVDFVKIDCEGYEHRVLEGARETLVGCKPTVIVEQKAHKLGANFGIVGRPACTFLLSLGAIQRAEIGGDFIFSWP